MPAQAAQRATLLQAVGMRSLRELLITMLIEKMLRNTCVYVYVYVQIECANAVDGCTYTGRRDSMTWHQAHECSHRQVQYSILNDLFSTIHNSSA
jgi:hypothetical protein